jgi:hypothetical protein
VAAAQIDAKPQPMFAYGNGFETRGRKSRLDVETLELLHAFIRPDHEAVDAGQLGQQPLEQIHPPEHPQREYLHGNGVGVAFGDEPAQAIALRVHQPVDVGGLLLPDKLPPPVDGQPQARPEKLFIYGRWGV